MVRLKFVEKLTPLMRLRLGFVALGLLLLIPLFALLSSAEARIERQRQLRREVVTERIFDELERELTAVLQQEQERNSYARYDVPWPWEPYIVGYFRVIDNRRSVVDEAILTQEGKRRMNWAMTRWLGSAAVIDDVHQDRALEQDQVQEIAPATEFKGSAAAGAPRRATASKSTTAAKRRRKPKKSSDVLRQLNRGKDSRQQQQKPAKSLGY